MTSESGNRSRVRIFELSCLAAIVAAGSYITVKAMGHTIDVADRAVDKAVQKAEAAITGKVDDRVDDVLETGTDLARDILQGTSEDASTDSNSKSPVDRLDSLLRRGTRLFGDLSDQIMGLDAEEESQVGHDVHRMVRAQQRIVNSPAQLNRLKRLAAPFLKARERPGIQYQFFVVESDAVNAFAHVGGYVYVNRGLLDVANGDEDALQFVLGHEIAHCELRHCASSMTFAVRAEEILPGAGSMASIAYKAMSVGYSEDHELDADVWSYRQMRRSGVSHPRAMQGVKMLQNHFGPSRKPRSRSPLRLIEAHFRTHPPIERRIEQLEREQSFSH